jgi:hypothetical protein
MRDGSPSPSPGPRNGPEAPRNQVCNPPSPSGASLLEAAPTKFPLESMVRAAEAKSRQAAPPLENHKSIRTRLIAGRFAQTKSPACPGAGLSLVHGAMQFVWLSSGGTVWWALRLKSSPQRYCVRWRANQHSEPCRRVVVGWGSCEFFPRQSARSRHGLEPC